jgi:hypothetical protein
MGRTGNKGPRKPSNKQLDKTTRRTAPKDKPTKGGKVDRGSVSKGK